MRIHCRAEQAWRNEGFEQRFKKSLEDGSLRPFAILLEEIVQILEDVGVKGHKFRIQAIDLDCLI